MFSETLLTQKEISREYRRQARQERLINTAQSLRSRGSLRISRLVRRFFS